MNNAETGAGNDLYAVEPAIRCGDVTIGAGQCQLLICKPPGHQKFGLTGYKIDRAGPQRFRALDTLAHGFFGTAGGCKRNTKTSRK